MKRRWDKQLDEWVYEAAPRSTTIWYSASERKRLEDICETAGLPTEHCPICRVVRPKHHNGDIEEG